MQQKLDQEISQSILSSKLFVTWRHYQQLYPNSVLDKHENKILIELFIKGFR